MMVLVKRYILPFIFSSTLSACGNQALQTHPKSSTPPIVDAYVPLKGIYVWGEGVETFKPCGQDKEYWVFTYTENMWEQLKREHQKLSAKPYGGVYIELNGVLGPKLHPIVGGEYAADFDGHIVIENIDVIRIRSATDCKS